MPLQARHIRNTITQPNADNGRQSTAFVILEFTDQQVHHDLGRKILLRVIVEPAAIEHISKGRIYLIEALTFLWRWQTKLFVSRAVFKRDVDPVYLRRCQHIGMLTPRGSFTQPREN